MLFFGKRSLEGLPVLAKKIAEEQSRLARAGRRSSRTRRLLYRTGTKGFHHAFEALAKHAAGVLKARKLGVLYVKDLTGVRADMEFDLLVHNFWVFQDAEEGSRGGVRQVGHPCHPNPPARPLLPLLGLRDSRRKICPQQSLVPAVSCRVARRRQRGFENTL